MDVTLDNLTTRKVFKEISKGVNFDERTLTTPIHLSDLTRCITKGYLRRLHATERSIPSSEEMMDDKSIIFMYLGTLAEEALSRIKPLVESIEVDGITGRADWVIDGSFTELKMTRTNVVRDKGKSNYMIPKKGIPGEWLRRIAGYSYMYEEDWKLSMLLIIPGDIVTYSFHWPEEELQDFWQRFIMPRKRTLEMALQTKQAPAPFHYQAPGECDDCEFRAWCATNRNRDDHLVNNIFSMKEQHLYMDPEMSPFSVKSLRWR